MAKPYDATTKHLIETYPADWLAFLGLSATHARIIDADLSTVTSEADKVILVEEPTREIVHLELQGGYDVDVVPRTLEYNVLIGRRHHLPVRSVIVLLRPEADRPSMGVTGKLEQRLADGTRNLEFVYNVIRVWELTVETILSGGLGTLLLAPISQVEEPALPEVIRRMEERIEAEAAREEAGELWVATYILMGLRYSQALAGQLLRGVRAMKESVTYQAILEEGEAKGLERGRTEGRAEGEAIGEARGEARGRAEEARALLRRIGEKRFGPAEASVATALDAIETPERLEQLVERALDVESWAELLA